MARVVLVFLLVVSVVAAESPLGLVKIQPETAAAFDRYVARAETKMKTWPRPQLRKGELRVEPGGDPAEVPGGMIQDWTGAMFLPGATLASVQAVLQDYGNYMLYYKPEVIDSREISHKGDDYEIFLRLHEKHILTVVLNANYHVEYRMPDAEHLWVTSHSRRIAEVKDPGKSYTDEFPAGNDSGYLWRLNSYWHFEAADGGVYAQCEAISLSRDVPLGLGFLLKGFLQSFPKESMQNTLRGTRDAVEKRRAGRPASSGRRVYTVPHRRRTES
ncbi:MAG TPA: hypothetical protein VMB25_04975 [Bryobacteraceae bacterium]|nr:hypothetical protein [Bryobacteraceae bacterium]